MESDGLTKGVNKPSTHKKMREERGEVSSFCRLRGGSHVFAREERREGLSGGWNIKWLIVGYGYNCVLGLGCWLGGVWPKQKKERERETERESLKRCGWDV
jgi:hypothetical protein